MVARVTGNATGATVSSVKPKVSVSVAFAVADASYILADATVYYIKPVLDAYLDTTGKFKFIMDVALPTDHVALQSVKNATDSISFIDSSLHEATKGVNDSVSFSDSVVRTLIFIRNFTDTVTAPDHLYLVNSKLVQDSFSQSEHLAFATAKLLTDGVAMSDTSSLNDGSVYSISKYISNIATPTDYNNKSVQKASSDAVTGVDSGYLYSQGYCDLTYFAEDYVGYYRTF